MAHPLAADLRDRDFDTAFLADDALVFHALVLAAQAFVILDRTEDARTEQAVTLRLERAGVGRLGLLDLAVGPAADPLRPRQSDLDLVERLRLRRGVHEVHQDWKSTRLNSSPNAPLVSSLMLASKVTALPMATQQ